jgi:hypothetical protein
MVADGRDAYKPGSPGRILVVRLSAAARAF